MSSAYPEAIEANVTVENPHDEDIIEIPELGKAVSWSESEKPKGIRRPSVLERARSKTSREENSSVDEDEEEEPSDDNDDIKPLEDQKRSISSLGSSKRPSFTKQTSRYEDRLRSEDLAVQAAYEKRKESKKSSHTTEKLKLPRKPTNLQPTLEEAYDFFTKVDWGPEDEEKFKRKQESIDCETKGMEATEESELGKDGDKKKLLPSSHYIGDKYLWDMTEKSFPFMSNKEADNICFVPSDRVDIEQKLGTDKQPRFLEDEGMYIGAIPSIKPKNQNKVEQRILLEQAANPDLNSKWFGSDGKLVALPTPILRKATRPAYLDDDLTHEPLTYFCPPTLPGPDGLPMPINPSGKVSSITQCQLEVDLSSIVFEHHHLFSLEHYLTNKLVNAYVTYSKVKSAQASKDLEQRLDVLYQSVHELKEKQPLWNEDERDFQGRRLQTYRTEIKTIIEERDADCKQERELTRTVLALWKEIREVRAKQGFQNTSHRVVIKKESSNLQADKMKWNYEIDRELKEAKEEFEGNFQQRLAQYEKDLEQWKFMHNRRRDARKRQKQRQKDAERGSGTADANEMADDEALLADQESEKPEKPTHFNDEDYKKQIEKRYFECRRAPGEPKLHLDLLQTMTTGSNGAQDIHDNRELNRRNAVSKTKIFARIFFNGKEVCQSTSRSMPQDFIVQLGQIFPIQIVQLPETLTLQIIEGGTLKSHIISEVKLPLCEPTKALSDSNLEPIEFKCDSKFQHDHAGLGSGINFPINLDGSKISNEPTKGKLFARVGWARGANGQLLAPPFDQWRPRHDKRMDPLHEVMEPDGKIDPAKLEEWMAKARLDPNDPENEELFNKVNEARRRADMSTISSIEGTSKLSHVTSTGYFRLDQHQDQLSFCTDAEIQENPRFQMIQLRRAKVPEFKNFRMIPILDKEVPKGILEARTKRALAKGKEVMDKGDPLRGRSRLYLEQLRAQVNHRFSLARHRRRHGDVVIEDPIPDSGTLIMLCGEMAPAQRPLRPIRIERKKVLMQDLTNQDIKVLLSIVRAFDVPLRCDNDPMVPSSATNIQGRQNSQVKEGLSEASVYSYIEAQFQGQTVRTTVAIGPNPAWNQELSLIFKSSNNDFSPETLNRVKDSLHLHLFDEITIDLVDDESQRSSQIHQRVEKKWLGSLSIPFSSLYRNARIEGTFKLHSPPVLLGYERSGIVGGLSLVASDSSTALGLGGGLAKNAKNATYLNIYATLQPALFVPEPVKEKLDCDEPENIVQHCLAWSNDLTSKYPQRRVNPLVAEVTGKSVFITRFFKSLKPPPELLDPADSKHSFLTVAWFVSLIPYVPSNALFPGLQDIWPTCDQFLQMMVGSENDHAILLCNFFASMGKKAFLVLGQGVPEGETSYVLTVEESGEHLLWNPVTGEQFATTETFCPLESVYAIANESNIWGNIQPGDKPARLRWDLAQTSDWVPLFTGNNPNPGLPSIQPSELILAQSDHRAAKQLKERIERTLRDSLMNLRKKLNLRTTMNFQGNAVLRKLLPGLEAAKGGLGTTVEGSTNSMLTEHLGELQRIMNSHKVCGFPLHFSFGDIDQLIEAVTATGVHLNREPGVEFALAVNVEPFPNSAMSVWIYVASLVRRR